MFCQHCANRLPDNSRFCNSCGEQVETATLPHSNELPARRSIVMGVVLGICILGLSGVAIYFAMSSRDEASSVRQDTQRRSTNAPASQPLSMPVAATIESPKPVSHPTHADDLVPSAFTLGAREFKAFKFTVSPMMTSVRVVGKFSASGGTGNDVEVFITDEDGLINFKNHHGFSGWYNSHKVTVADINVPLSNGDYYLVFSNSFSLMSNKAVQADIKLNWVRI